LPHCIIEFSEPLTSRLAPAELLQKVHEGALKSALFQAADIKTRAQSYEHFFSESEQVDFIHVTIRIMAGRTDEQKQHLSASVLNALSDLGLTEISITVEVVDLHNSSYAKYLA